MTAVAPDLARQGGKGANLLRLAAAGLPVPRFVVIETDEYEAFVGAAGLNPVIRGALGAGAGAASVTIRAAFGAAALPHGQADRLRAMLEPFADARVAVRSSATAEDLPGFSFAGQQDTFLDVTGLDAVLEAVVACWSSLWTERAIAYRERNAIGHEGVSLAVVIQEMVDADASGVLFTANPRTGRRDETVIDAVHGLGEALVSGRVTPDSFVVETATGGVREQTLAGSSASSADGSAEGREGGGASLTPAQVRHLTALGRRIADHYGEPMDIEWARVGDEISILQARPITSLYPLPAADPRPHELPEVWFSFGAFQGMLEPMTPLGQDLIRMMLSGAPRLVGRKVEWRTNRFVQPAGERLWLRLDGVLRTRATRALLVRSLPMIDPGIAAIVGRLADEPGLRVVRAVPRTPLVASLLRVFAGVGARVRSALGDPVGARTHVERVAERLLAAFERVLVAADGQGTPQARLAARVAAMEWFSARVFPALLPAFGPIMGPTMMLLTRLREEARKTGLPDADALALNVLRALPGNVTTEMDLALADVAGVIRSDANAWGWVAETPASDLARQYLRGNLPRVAQDAVAGFLAEYGMRGVAEIDLGAPRWRDDPTSVMHTLKAYVAVTDPARAPRVLHKQGQHEAGRSIRTLMDASPRGRAERIRSMAKVIRGMFGARETPKFMIIRAFGLLRQGLDASARELVAEGRLGAASDLYFLHVDELRHAFSSDWHQVVAERRAIRDAEARRGQVPRVLVSDGRAFYEGLSSEGDLAGVGVSSGVAEGPVRVIRDPRTQQLQPGEILVCVGTDPAWTPLFLTAGGLITEVGGLMTHGSVVAREYGIPAVVGVHAATTRLVDGQRIRLDGNSGAIELL